MLDPYNILPELFEHYPDIDTDVEILPMVCRDSFQATTRRTLFIGQEPDHNPYERYSRQFLARPNSMLASSTLLTGNKQFFFPINIILTSRANRDVQAVDLGTKTYLATALFGGWMDVRCHMINRMQQLELLDKCLATCRPRRDSVTDESIIFEGSNTWIDYYSPAIADLDSPVFLKQAHHVNGIQTMSSIGEHARISNLIARDIYNSCYISVVAETENLLDPTTFYISEKTAKPLIVGHPFLIYGCQHFLKHLRDMGFKTFSPWLDESYDDISDRYQRADAIVNSLLKFSQLTDLEKQQACVEMQPTTNHNRQLALNNHELLKSLVEHL